MRGRKTESDMDKANFIVLAKKFVYIPPEHR